MNIEQLDKKQLIKYGLIGIAALLIGLLVFNFIYNRPAEPKDINDEHYWSEVDNPNTSEPDIVSQSQTQKKTKGLKSQNLQ